MKKAILVVITALICATVDVATANPTSETANAVYKVHLGGTAELSIQVTASYLNPAYPWEETLDRTLHIYEITVDFSGSSVSVSYGKTTGSYLVTMDMVDIFGGKYQRTFPLNLKRDDFLEYVAKEHRAAFKRSIKKEAVVLDEDLTLIWNPQPPKKLAKAN